MNPDTNASIAPPGSSSATTESAAPQSQPPFARREPIESVLHGDRHWTSGSQGFDPPHVIASNAIGAIGRVQLAQVLELGVANREELGQGGPHLLRVRRWLESLPTSFVTIWRPTPWRRNSG